MENSNERDEYLYEIRKQHNKSYKNIMLFKLHKEYFKDRNGDKLKWIIGSFLVGCLVFFILINLYSIGKTELYFFNKKYNNNKI